MADEQGLHEWSVTAQQQTMGQNAQGQYVDGYRVSFTTSKGLSGSVFVPVAQYTAEAVRALIENQVRGLADVHGLSGSI